MLMKCFRALLDLKNSGMIVLAYAVENSYCESSVTN